MNNRVESTIKLAVVISMFLIMMYFTFILIKNNQVFNILSHDTNKIITTNTDQNVYMNAYPSIALDDMWNSYKKNFIQKDGRTIDTSADLITTSEGQSYSMLRAVWSDDKETFDTVWKWTNVNLKKRGTDNLFAWKWGKNTSGQWTILTDQGGLNTASDADQDIAMALIIANYRWSDPYYLTQAKQILNDIWSNDVVIINNKPYLIAGNWAQDTNSITVNPSYYSLGAYPVFAKVDPAHDWLALKSTSYDILNKSTQLIPPDWLSVDRNTLQTTPIALNGKDVGFAQDALRIPWRVALDWVWNKDTRAKDYLTKLNFFDNQWNKNNTIWQSYKLDGTPVDYNESLSLYSSLLPYFSIVDPKAGQQIYEQKVVQKFNQDTGDFRENIGYYDANWSWFGIALYNNKLFATVN